MYVCMFTGISCDQCGKFVCCTEQDFANSDLHNGANEGHWSDERFGVALISYDYAVILAIHT